MHLFMLVAMILAVIVGAVRRERGWGKSSGEVINVLATMTVIATWPEKKQTKGMISVVVAKG
jgi:hypothetical protein